MVQRIDYKTYNSFLKNLEAKEWTLVKRIVASVMEGVKKNKKKVDIFEIYCSDEDMCHYFGVTSDNYIQILEEGMNSYIDRELYEECVIIKKSIEKCYENKNQKLLL